MSTETLAATLAKPGKFLSFVLGSEEYGVEIAKVQQIVGIMDVTRVPRTPGFVRGVINLRGRVIPVVDLRGKFQMPAVADTEKTCIIVVQVSRDDLAVTRGIIVDEVSEVLSFQQEQIEATPRTVGGMDEAEYVTGMGKLGKKVVILLDVDRVLEDEGVAAVARVAR